MFLTHTYLFSISIDLFLEEIVTTINGKTKITENDVIEFLLATLVTWMVRASSLLSPCGKGGLARRGEGRDLSAPASFSLGWLSKG